MPSIIAKGLLIIVVALVFSGGFYIRPQAKRPTPAWQLLAVFAIGLFIGVVMLTTHSLYIHNKA